MYPPPRARHWGGPTRTEYMRGGPTGESWISRPISTSIVILGLADRASARWYCWNATLSGPHPLPGLPEWPWCFPRRSSDLCRRRSPAGRGRIPDVVFVGTPLEVVVGMQQ